MILLYILSYSNIQNSFSQNVTGNIEGFQNMTAGNFSGNATESSTVEGLGVPRQLTAAEFNNRVPTKAQNIAMELTKLSPTEIRQYPISILSAEEIGLALELLNPHNLAKVLLNISQEDLAELQSMLPPSVLNQALNRLSDADRTQVQDRL